jgi:endonuclease YncB( thermonuclease family)
MKGSRAGRGLLGLVVLGAMLAPAYAGDSLYGRVTQVRDADLITLNYGAGAYEIRLVGVQVPKTGAQHAAALRFVSDLLLGKNARMRLVRRAPTGELVCRLFTDDPVIGIKEVGVEMLRAGLATRQPDYDEKYGELAKAESEARAAQRGLWASK